LAFHPYPQLIPQVFNPGGFGPPRPLTAASPWPWVDHSASGLHPATPPPPPPKRQQGRLRPIRTRFRYGYPTRVNLATKHNSQAHSSKGTPSPPHPHPPKGTKDAATALTACRRTVSGTLSLPSRGTFHHSLTVLSAIGHQGVFRLTGWSRQIHSRFHEPAATRGEIHDMRKCFHVRGSHPLRQPIPESSANTTHTIPSPAEPSQQHPTTPHPQPLPSITRTRFSLLRFRSPLLTESLLFSLPVGTEMFHFPTFPPTPYEFRCW
jgi:hypothetical protein